MTQDVTPTVLWQRRNLVINQMVMEGYITTAQALKQ